MEIPVIIAHQSTSPRYLSFALNSAAQFNSRVVLIGDESNKDVWRDHWDTTLIVPQKYENFVKHYIKMSDYSQEYEISFWKRMFLLEEWMKRYDCHRAILLDSDVVSFVNYTKDIYPLLPVGCLSALMIPQNQADFIWTASTHFSYWTLEGIENFNNFCIDTYSGSNGFLSKLKDKHKWHTERDLPGGVSEMTLLYLWFQSNERVYNFAKVTDNTTSDLSIHSPCNYFENEYSMKFGVKKMVFKNGVPHGYNKILNREIKFSCLHCQGRYKPMMRFLVSKKTKNTYFYYLGKVISELRYFSNLSKRNVRKLINL